jgi:hypothetical protein
MLCKQTYLADFKTLLHHFRWQADESNQNLSKYSRCVTVDRHRKLPSMEHKSTNQYQMWSVSNSRQYEVQSLEYKQMYNYSKTIQYKHPNTLCCLDQTKRLSSCWNKCLCFHVGASKRAKLLRIWNMKTLLLMFVCLFIYLLLVVETALLKYIVA